MAADARRAGVTSAGAAPPAASAASPDADLPLSPRELEIARLICLGLSNKEIAQFLEISHFTVGAHVRRMFDKLRINRRTRLAAYLIGVEAASADRSHADGRCDP